MSQQHIYRKQISSDFFISSTLSALMFCFFFTSLYWHNVQTKAYCIFVCESVGRVSLAQPCKEKYPFKYNRHGLRSFFLEKILERQLSLCPNNVITMVNCNLLLQRYLESGTIINIMKNQFS